VKIGVEIRTIATTTEFGLEQQQQLAALSIAILFDLEEYCRVCYPAAARARRVPRRFSETRQGNAPEPM
jgi:hypothetical protein